MSCDPKENFDDYICVFYSSLTDEKLLNLFYVFDENRVFKDLDRKPYETIEDICLFFADNKDLFNDKHIKEEKRHFFKIKKQHAYNSLSYESLLFEIFKDKANIEVKFVSLENLSGEWKVSYNCYKSLSEYLWTSGIQNNLTYGANNKFEFSAPKNNISSFESLNKKLFDHINNTHNIPENLLTKRNRNDFKKDLKKIFHQETRRDQQQKVMSTLDDKRIFISVVCASLVFIYFALNWGNWTGNIWDAMKNLSSSLPDANSGFVDFSNRVNNGQSTGILTIPIILIFSIIKAIIYSICFIIIGGTALGFPIITAIAIYLFSNKLLESHVKNNVVSSKAIIIGYTLFTLICGWFIISLIRL